MTTKSFSLLVACLVAGMMCSGEQPGNKPTNVTGYVVSTGTCENELVLDGKTSKETVPLTMLELAEMKPVPKALSNRPNVWKRTGQEITLYNYKFTGKFGSLLSVTIVPTNALEGKISYAVVDKPPKSPKK